MSLEIYGPPEREAQGCGLMKREKEGAADSSHVRNTHIHKNGREEEREWGGGGNRKKKER